jgi:murein L,D-transpeptidase YcbB/YkuD
VFTEPPVIVNVPAFRLHAFSSSSDRESDLLSMDVVVGDAFDHRTPVFSDSLRYLVFSPYWDVPPSIARKEIIPRARRDGSYLERNQYEIVDGSERAMAPTGAALSAVAAGRARIRQLPGPTNALGRVKFIFPNAHNVYFHDTPSQAPFGRARRDVSHGCIRLSDPARLARFMLRNQAGWDSTRIAAAMSRVTPQQVSLPRPVPVHIVYATAVAREDGRVFFFDDIYGHDRTLAKLIGAGYPYAR